MPPTSRTERRRRNPDGTTKDQSKDGITTAQEAKSDFELNGELLRRTLSELFGRVGDEDEDEREDDRSDIGLSLPDSPPLPSVSLPPPLQIPPNPLSNILPLPKTEPPPAAPPPQQPLPSSSSIVQPPPSIPPPSSSILPPSSSVLPPSSTVPPQQSATGISGNFASPSPPASPRRTTLSAALPQSTGSGNDGGDDGDGGSTSSTASPTRSTFSKSTRSILSLTPAIAPYYETQSTETDEPTSSISRTESTTRSLTTSTSSPVQTSETTTRTETSTTSISSPSGTAAIDQGGEAARTSRLSPGGEKAVIASVTIVGFFILLALAWFLWRRSSKRKAAGRKRTWPANFPSREILEAPRRVSSKVGEKVTSIKSHLRRPSALSLCGFDDDDAPMNEKPAAPVAAKAGGLLQRRLGNSASPHRITVNSYGMIFRKPRRDSALSDIFLPTGQPIMSPQSPLERGRERGPPQSPPERFRESVTPPSPEEIRIPIVQTNSKLAAAAHLENARKSVNTGTNSTPRSPLPRNHRVSNASSSLSSGFGDGDIVITQPPAAATAVKTANPGVVDLHVNVVAVRSSPVRKHFSSRFSRNRDTVLTNESGSDDMHPRFRSISSWVGQQSRRVRRAAASRNEDGVPNVPDILPEQGFDMMMPDGQEPRRVESSMYIK
ncbi:hypothetical protein V8C35DRAFT_278696 [Trichoderma chlorosporum]